MSGTRPAVSVLMTAYNREAFVGEAIASVLAQTNRLPQMILSILRPQ